MIVCVPQVGVGGKPACSNRQDVLMYSSYQLESNCFTRIEKDACVLKQ